MKFSETIHNLKKLSEEFGFKMFLGTPDFWYEKPGPKYRCKNEHVSDFVLKSEEKGCLLCLACMEKLFITFPFDKDGPVNLDNAFLQTFEYWFSDIENSGMLIPSYNSSDVHIENELKDGKFVHLYSVLASSWNEALEYHNDILNNYS